MPAARIWRTPEQAHATICCGPHPVAYAVKLGAIGRHIPMTGDVHSGYCQAERCGAWLAEVQNTGTHAKPVWTPTGRGGCGLVRPEAADFPEVVAPAT